MASGPAASMVAAVLLSRMWRVPRSWHCPRREQGGQVQKAVRQCWAALHTDQVGRERPLAMRAQLWYNWAATLPTQSQRALSDCVDPHAARRRRAVVKRLLRREKRNRACRRRLDRKWRAHGAAQSAARAPDSEQPPAHVSVSLSSRPVLLLKTTAPACAARRRCSL